MYTLPVGLWVLGGGWVYIGVINIPSIPWPELSTIVPLSLSQSGGLSEVHSGMNGGFLVLS